jgi:hypothetical protein
VQNASSGHPEPLLSVSRTDIVTVCMRVPDSYAPYITSGTEAVLEMSELPGQRIHGKVTRFTPSLQTDTRLCYLSSCPERPGRAAGKTAHALCHLYDCERASRGNHTSSK